MKKYKINIFDLNIYIENNKQITETIQNKLKERNLSVKQLAKRINLSSTTIYPFLKGSSMKSQNLRKIFDFLNIDYKYLEKQEALTVYSGPYKSRRYNLKFPIEMTPLHIRVVSHFLGDGSLEKYGCRWYQKSNIGGKYMIDLIFSLTNIRIKKSKNNSYGIPIIIGDIVMFALNLSRKDLKTSKFIEKVIVLPKEFKVQLLAAFIVDEGYVTKSYIKISNTNFELLKSLKKMMMSLRYSCSEIKNSNKDVGKEIYIKNNKTRINYDLYNLYIYADGLLKFKEDLNEMINKYGDIVGLWQKQRNLILFSSKVDLSRLNKTRNSKNNLIPLIKKEIVKGPIKIKDFAKNHDLDYIRAYKLFFRLKEKEEIKKISTGVFASRTYCGSTNLTLKSNIESLKGKITLKEIIKLTNSNVKSVSAQLSRLCKEGKIKRIKKGIYLFS